MNIVNEKVTAYLDNLYRPVNEFLGQLRVDAEEKKVPIILKDTETSILNIIRMKKPRRILEIGTAVGYSAICFAQVSPEAEIISLEVSEEMYLIATENIEKCGLTNRIQIKLGDAVEGLRDMKVSIANPESDGFDLVFIDASKGHYKEFWDGSIPLCKKDAVILSDNVLFQARTVSDEYVTEKRQKTMVRRMREYIQYITNLDYADTAVLSVGDGIAVSVLRGENEEN
ncbi:MAG: O-methyltransferase [Bacillota bacterium]